MSLPTAADAVLKQLPKMRLHFIPISTRRSLIYCQKFPLPTTAKPGIVDRITQKAATTWTDWEKKENGWQKKLTEYGNKALQKIPYEEWALKSIPPLSTQAEMAGRNQTVPVVFPKTVVQESKVMSALRTLATERMGFHKKRLVGCIIGMPLSAPFMLVPVIPNIPFFYLAYRAWSHWSALSGAKHLQFLLEKKLLQPISEEHLDIFYAEPLEKLKERTKELKPDSKELDDAMLLTWPEAKHYAETLESPELAVELERAIWQVSAALEAEKTEARKRRAANEKRE